MTYKQIEASREIRLWIGQVVVPTLGLGAVAMSNPEIKNAIKTKFEDVKSSIAISLI
uniref:Uncharacterized protein n=1 Tax=Siphoviridae sp. ct9lR64 TaxID=2826178 RepID=A0A8S5QYT4_9CAUD|nr:MAG TPA: hypothetical protein [Siphoviridae sp. ct9lR64]